MTMMKIAPIKLGHPLFPNQGIIQYIIECTDLALEEYLDIAHPH